MVTVAAGQHAPAGVGHGALQRAGDGLGGGRDRDAEGDDYAERGRHESNEHGTSWEQILPGRIVRGRSPRQ